MRNMTTLVRKECVENLSASRAVVMFMFVCILMSVYSILLISNTEMSLLDNAHAAYMLATLVLIVSLLIILLLGSDGIAGERERRTLEALLLSPANGCSILASKLFAILFIWLILFGLSLPYLWAIAGNGQNLVPAIIALLVTGTFCMTIVGGISLIISMKFRTVKGAIFTGITIFLLLVSPAILGPSLRNNAIGRFVDAIDPVMGAINTLDSVIIDSQGISFQLFRLGVMLFYAIGVLTSLYYISRKVEL
ncbi:MAG: hypothetical protein A2Y13_04565 [Planctomycetes bacterium GWC2_45_44]|nr:MAG: hypothetical protein A2Y13_04565 [Planctomycetes bacterium GWC2_45_44]